MAQVSPEAMVESPGAMTPTDSQAGHGSPQPSPKLRGRKRLLQSLQRISSSPSLAKIGRMSSSGYRSGGRGSISCVSLSSPAAMPYAPSHDNSQASDPSSTLDPTASPTVPNPAQDIPFVDQAKGRAGIRLIDADAINTAKISASVPLPAELRPGSKGLPLEKTTEVSEGAEEAECGAAAAAPRAASAARPKSRANADFWSSAPDEINMQILRHLAPKEIIRCSAVSRSWQKMCFDGQLWSTLDASEFYRDIPSDALSRIITSAGPFVRDLNLRGCVQLQIDLQAEALSEACQNLQNLCLEGCQIDRSSVHYLLLRNSSLVHLNLSGLAAVSNATCKIIGQQCRLLEFFNVNWCHSMDARGVGKVIDGCPRLKDLRVNECRGFVDKHIMARLFETNTLERLFMHGCSDVRDDDLKVLFEGIEPDVCPLTRRAMVPPRKLRHLDISKMHYLTEKGLRSMVGNVPELEGLQLGGNVELTDEALVDLLPTVPRLTHLDLEECALLTNESLKSIGRAPCAERLEHLSFSYCEEVGDSGMMPLIRACRSLRNLDMDNTRVSDLSLAEAATLVRRRSRRSDSACQPEVGLRVVIYDCQNITWTGIREVISRNAEIKRPTASGDGSSYPTEVVQLKCFYGWQMTVDEHIKRVLKGDLAAASRLERKWAEYMMATEEAGAIGAGSRRRRRRAREAAMLHADEEEGGAGTGGVGRRRRARSNGCTVM
ncbi:MAG: hypothetical protein M1832_000903 [Thelocarpon impressellum]|nr:MAG: hypothetical protein M1832_000903 [Thelocarpon impressellum]